MEEYNITISVSQLPFGLGTIRDPSTRPGTRRPFARLNCLSAWERFGTRFITFSSEPRFVESQLPFGLGTIRDYFKDKYEVVVPVDSSQLPFGLGTIRDPCVGAGRPPGMTWSQLPFGLGTIRDHIVPFRSSEPEKKSQLPFGLGTIRDMTGPAHSPPKYVGSQLPFGLGTIRDGERKTFRDIFSRVSIAFRLGNDSGQRNRLTVNVFGDEVSIAFRLGNDSGLREQARDIGKLHRVSIAFRLGNDSGQGAAKGLRRRVRQVSIAFRLGNDSGHQDENAIYCESATQSQLPFGLGTIRDGQIEVTYPKLVLSQLPFGLGTIRDGRYIRLGQESVGVSIAFRLGNDSGHSKRIVVGLKFYVSQLPFGLGTIRDVAGHWCMDEAETEESQLPFGLGTIRDLVKLRFSGDRYFRVSIAFRLGNDSGLYPFFPRFASGCFGRFRLAGIFEDCGGAHFGEDRGGNFVETQLQERDFAKRSDRFSCGIVHIILVYQ